MPKFTLALSLAIFSLQVVHAQIADSWTGTGANDLWSTSGNWTAGAPSGTGDMLVFNQLTMSNSNVTADLDIANLNVAGVELISTDGSSIGSARPGFDLISSSHQTLTIGNSSYSGFIDSSSTAAEVMNINIVAGSALSVSGGNSLEDDGPLDLNGTVNNGGFLITESGLTNIAGAISGAGGLTVNGTATLTGHNSYTGDTDVTGNLTVQSGTLIGTSHIVVASGASLTVSTSTVNSAASVEVDGSTFTDATSALTGSQQLGQLTLQADTQSHVILQQIGSLAETEVDFSNVSAPTTDTLLWVSGNNLGATAGTNGSSRLLFTSAPATVGGTGAVGTTTVGVVPWALGSAFTDADPSALLTYDPTTGLRPLNSSEYVTNINTAALNENVRLTAADTLSSDKTIGSLVVVYNVNNSYTLDLGGHTLGVSSGAVLDATPVSGFTAGAPLISDGTINFGAATGYLTNTDITANIEGSGGLVVDATSELPDSGGTLGGNNTYTGITYINGIVFVNSNNALGAIGAGNGTVINDGGMRIGAGVSLSEDITVNSVDTAESGQINFLGNGQLNGVLTVANTGGLQLSTYSGNVTVGGNITTSGTGTRTLFFDDYGGTTGGFTINGAISDTSTAPLTVAYGLFSKVSGTNTYTGGSYIQGTVTATNAKAFGTGFVDDEATLIFNIASNATFSNAISDIGIVDKNGSSTLALTGANSYSGGTVINGGTLQIAADSAIGSSSGALTINAGTLEVTGSFNSVSTSRAITLGSTTSTIQVDAGDSYSANGLISGTGELTVAGGGTLVLGTNGVSNTYSGGTLIEGTLKLNNSASSTITDTGTGAVTIASGGTLTGIGEIRSKTNSGVTVQAGGTLAMGPNFFSTTTLTLDRSLMTSANVLTVNKGGDLDFTLLGSAADILTITGGTTTLTFALGATDNVFLTDDSGGHLIAGSELLLIQGDGSTTYSNLTLGANSVQYGRQITAGLTLGDDAFFDEFDHSTLYEKGDNIYVVIETPEPTTFALMFSGLSALLLLFRRVRALRFA